jgi:hypothetical protein
MMLTEERRSRWERVIEGRDDGDFATVAIGGLRSALAEIDSWKLRAELAEAALKPVEAERDRQEQLMEDALEFTKKVARVPDAACNSPLLQLSIEAQSFLDRRAKLYDERHKPK